MVKWIKNTKAFTLIEVMVVIAIMAILTAIVIPNFINYVDKLKSKEKPAVEQQYEQKKDKGGHQGVY